MTLVDRAAQIKAALLKASQQVVRELPDGDSVLVCNGHPGPNYPDDVVSWTRFYATQEPGPISQTNRSRWVEYRFEVLVSVIRGGGLEMEPIAEARAQQLLTAIEEYVRVTDTTLGGLVEWCFCTSIDSEGTTEPEIIAHGRISEVSATFTARARITSR